MLRKEVKITQSKLSLISGLDRTFISMLERGVRGPSLHTVFQLSKALDISPSEFVELVTQRRTFNLHAEGIFEELSPVLKTKLL
ncbi:MAG: helix-turn-helix transcriptional regulator [Pseudomonadota bacterium]